MLNKFYSPLEQFDLLYISSILGFNIANIVLFFSILFFFFFFIIGSFRGFLFLPNFLQKIYEFIYLFIIDMLVQQAGLSAVKYFPYMFLVFLVILFSNLIGMLPFSFTITAHLSITFFLAFSFNFGFIILGFYKNGYKFLYLFKPAGTPLFLLPLIIVIEVASYLIRTFSLSIRLFANMMAGHCSLFVISSFVFSLLNLSIFLIFPIILVYLAIFILEFSIAFLQAYVFTILLCIYLNDSLHPVH